MKLIFTFILFVIIDTKTSFGFVESYSFFGSLESDKINTPEDIDGEYYSDILAFRHSLVSDYNFFSSQNAYDIYVGSISSKQFAIQQRLKLNQKISDQLTFNLAYLEIENFEIGREQFISGLTYSLNSKLSFSAYTSLFSNKDQNDIGTSLNINLNSNHTITFFVNFIDFGFNKRNQIEAVDQKNPLHFGLQGQWLNDTFEFLNYYIFQNSSVSREFTLSDERYVFEESKIGFNGRLKILNSTYYNFDISAFQSEEGKTKISSPDPLLDIKFNRNGFMTLNQLEIDNLILGLEYNYRYWISNQGNVQHSNLIPHIWYKKHFPKYKYFPHRLDFGLETSIHSAQGPKALRHSLDSEFDVNSRFNTRLHFEFSKTAFLNLLLSADIDDKFSWEGGGGQFQILF